VNQLLIDNGLLIGFATIAIIEFIYILFLDINLQMRQRQIVALKRHLTPLEIEAYINEEFNPHP
jgi:hypothetical protein